MVNVNQKVLHKKSEEYVLFHCIQIVKGGNPQENKEKQELYTGEL